MIAARKLSLFVIKQEFFQLKSVTRCKSSSLSSNKNDAFESDEFVRKIASLYDKQGKTSIYHRQLDLTTLFLHRKWRKAIVEQIQIRKDLKILDAAGGTGLTAFKLLEKIDNSASRFSDLQNFLITVSDKSSYMLDMGMNCFKRMKYDQNLIKFVQGNLHQLPFDDRSFDIVILSLAIKTPVNLRTALREINRVLKPSGQLIVLDYNFSKKHTLIQRLYLGYLKNISSKLEKLVLGTNDQVSEYLVSEFCNVVSNTDVKAMMKEANFQNLKCKEVTLGLTALTIGYKAESVNK